MVPTLKTNRKEEKQTTLSIGPQSQVSEKSIKQPKVSEGVCAGGGAVGVPRVPLLDYHDVTGIRYESWVHVDPQVD